MIDSQETTGYDHLLMGLARSITQRKWVILVVFVTCVSCAVFYSLSSAKIYETSAVLTSAESDSDNGLSGVGGQLGGLIGLAGLGGGLGADNKLVESLAILESEAFVTKYLVDNSLVPLFTEQSENAEWFAAHQFINKSLRIDQDLQSGLITLTLRHKSRTDIAGILNNLVNSLNELMRNRALKEANKSLEFLNSRIDETSQVVTRDLLYRLAESELSQIMLANVREDYVLRFVDPASTPNEIDYVHPKLPLLVVLSLMLAAVLSVSIVIMLDFVVQLRRSSSVRP